MAHPEQRNFCLEVKGIKPEYFKDKEVLDVGSLDINGNNRYLFENCNYIGIDVGEGKNVTTVSFGHAYKGGPFDTVISTEAFEHDKMFPETIKNIVYSLLKPGGLFLFTCGSHLRGEHGTARTTPTDSPLTMKIEGWENYYKGVSIEDVNAAIPVVTLFSEFHSRYRGHDLYFWGIKHV